VPRDGDFDALVAVLDPEVGSESPQRHARRGTDRGPGRAGLGEEGAIAFSRLARFNRPVLVDGTVGEIVAPRGPALPRFRFTFEDGAAVRSDPPHALSQRLITRCLHAEPLGRKETHD
jgi:RNA polymerase sigma-70 factor (ECF subfamily)